MSAIFLCLVNSFEAKADANIKTPKLCLDIPDGFSFDDNIFFHSLNTFLRNYRLAFSNFTASRNMIFEDSYSYTIF